MEINADIKREYNLRGMRDNLSGEYNRVKGTKNIRRKQMEYDAGWGYAKRDPQKAREFIKANGKR